MKLKALLLGTTAAVLTQFVAYCLSQTVETKPGRPSPSPTPIGLRIFFITSSGHDCDHAPLRTYGKDRLEAWLNATRQAQEANDQGAIAFLSVPFNYITVWTEEEFRTLDWEGFMEDCKKRHAK